MQTSDPDDPHPILRLNPYSTVVRRWHDYSPPGLRRLYRTRCGLIRHPSYVELSTGRTDCLRCLEARRTEARFDRPAAPQACATDARGKPRVHYRELYPAARLVVRLRPCGQQTRRWHLPRGDRVPVFRIGWPRRMVGRALTSLCSDSSPAWRQEGAVEITLGVSDCLRCRRTIQGEIERRERLAAERGPSARGHLGPNPAAWPGRGDASVVVSSPSHPTMTSSLAQFS